MACRMTPLLPRPPALGAALLHESVRIAHPPPHVAHLNSHENRNTRPPTPLMVKLRHGNDVKIQNWQQLRGHLGTPC